MKCYQPFPIDSMPEPIASYVEQGAAALGCDSSFLALPILSGLASAIGNTHRVAIKASWSEPAILWTAVVGESGTLKSPAIEHALRPVRDRQHRAMMEHARAVKLWEAEYARFEAERKSWKPTKGKESGEDPPVEPERPICPRTWTDDITTEALVLRLQENPRGLLMVRDELSGWFDFGRYAPGGKGGTDVAKWLEVFGARALIVDRKTSDTLYVPRAAVSIAGGIQPETLRCSLGQENRDNGLAARLLFAMPERRAKRWADADIEPRVAAAAGAVFDRLYSLEPDADKHGEPAPHLVRLDSAAMEAWVTFYNEHADEQHELSGDEAAAWSKLEGYAARIALVVHLTRWAGGDAAVPAPGTPMDEASIRAGVTLSRWFGEEARRVYAILRESESDRDTRRLIEFIERKGGAVSARDVMRGGPCYPYADVADKALNRLYQAGLGVWEQSEAGCGRPTTRLRLHDSADADETPSDGPV